MSEYEFKLCTYADKTAIVQFMKENWGSEHPLIHNSNFFTHYYDSAKDIYGDSENRPLQFAIAMQNSAIVAIAGYIYTSRQKPIDIWVSIWCAVKGKNGVGLELMEKLPQLTGARVMACNNIRPKTMPFYTFLGYTAQMLPHYYRLADKATYSIANVAKKTILPVSSSHISLRLIQSFNQLQSMYTPNLNLRPNKDLWYIKRRYFDYPYKKYEVYAITDNNDNNKCTCLLIVFTANANNTNVLRIVDFIGEPNMFASLSSSINKLMIDKNAEYADCYCYGISEDTFNKAGFIMRRQDDNNIIPNYLYPPAYENTDYYFFTTDSNNFTMFKADGDQDRPNIT